MLSLFRRIQPKLAHWHFDGNLNLVAGIFRHKKLQQQLSNCILTFWRFLFVLNYRHSINTFNKLYFTRKASHAKTKCNLLDNCLCNLSHIVKSQRKEQNLRIRNWMHFSTLFVVPTRTGFGCNYLAKLWPRTVARCKITHAKTKRIDSSIISDNLSWAGAWFKTILCSILQC